MKTQFHRAITVKALSAYFRAEALETIVGSNLGQDALRYQFGHDHFHYDSNSFAVGDAYCDELRHLVVVALQKTEATQAREFLGRLTHTVQDLYAHSNYVGLWREIYPGATSDEIDPQLPEIMKHPRLHSGKLYYPLEAFSFIKVLNPFVIPWLPRDSHAWMNIDEPSRPDFDFAFAAAVKRTGLEYLRICEQLSPQEIAVLTGNSG